MNLIPVIAIVGPTASGKTKLSIDIAKKYNAEIVSCDSMQIYKGMDIATAKPTVEEQNQVKHHLISEINRDVNFSVADYREIAKQKIDDIVSRGKNVVLVGGTGFYSQALLENVQFLEVKGDSKLRAKLEQRAKVEGNESLLNELMKIDEETAKMLHPNNLKRIIRALEVYYLSGKTMTQQVENSRVEPTPYKSCVIGLDYSDRQKLYDRINMRVDIMLEDGLIEETKQYMNEKHDNTANQAIGCKEMAKYLAGQASLEQATEKLKMETRRYAKRQLTWFRRKEYVNWIHIDQFESYEDVFKRACNIIDDSKVMEADVIGKE